MKVYIKISILILFKYLLKNDLNNNFNSTKLISK